MGDGPQRLAGVAGLLESLYPGARAVVGDSPRRTSPGRTRPEREASDRALPARGDESAGQRVFRVLPSRSRPRLLVPAELPGVAGPALQRVSAIDRRRDVIARRMVAAVAGGRLGPHLLRTTITVGPVGGAVAGGSILGGSLVGGSDAGGSIEGHLGEVVDAPVRLSVQIGAERANAKAVLGVYRLGDATEVGFCKVGGSALAGRLVRHEAVALRRLEAAGLRHLDVPPILHVGRWRDSDLLLIGSVRGSRGAGRGLPYDAMREVASVGGRTEVALRDSPWVADVRGRLEAAGPDHGEALRTGLDALVERDAELLVPHGTWHGDWGPWNMAWQADRPVVWDWERCTSGVPVGLDAAHFVGHPPLRRIDELDVALAALAGPTEAAVSTVLEPWVETAVRAQTARCVVDAYVLEIACRFAVDAAEMGTAPVARLASWYLQVAASRLDLRLDVAGRT